MANLIPTDAKRELKIQYWIRVVTVWCALAGVGALIIAALHAPAFVLVRSQSSSYSGEYIDAKEQTKTFSEAQTVIKEANNLAILLSDTKPPTSMMTLTTILDGIAGDDVTIKTVRYNTEETALSAIQITGTAATRVALAAFSDNLEQHPLFSKADVPISNLAKDRDIEFNIDVVPAETES